MGADVVPGPVEDVITTAIALVTGRLAPREAVTILATLAPTAMRAAPAVLAGHPDQAASRAAVMAALATEIGAADDDKGQRRRVVGDLMDVARALGLADVSDQPGGA
ncbi:MAG: hypothetical protein M3011_00830 [Actinomycetota bacterium]|nr:hypothetical protein [Actinomycetota bacterium]